MKELHIYCDGSCLRNPGGDGGWAAVMIWGEHRKELTGFESSTTNNRMELSAVLGALYAIKRHNIPIVVFTDSKYVRNGITEWIIRWKRNGWRTSDNQEVKNKDLWVELDAICKRLQPTFKWVKGHNGHPDNERADELAGIAARRQCEQR